MLLWVAAAELLGSMFVGMWSLVAFVVSLEQQVAVSKNKEAHAVPISIYRTSRAAGLAQYRGGSTIW